MRHVLCGDARAVMREMDERLAHCCITSPPYWGLRKYEGAQTVMWDDGEFALGLEPTPEMYVAHIVEVFREVRRVLRDDGTCWVVIGDCYSAHLGQRRPTDKPGRKQATNAASVEVPSRTIHSLKPKDLCLIPFRVASALQADGWWLRSIVIWAKPNPMPESVTDRPTTAHEYVFLLSKSARYYYDADAIREPIAESSTQRISQDTFGSQAGGSKDYQYGVNPNRSARHALENFAKNTKGMRNKRTVWTVPTSPYKEAHFATFPPKLIEPMILAGCPEGGTVLDPFAGSGTVGLVAAQLGRDYVLIDISEEYCEMAQKRIGDWLI